MSLFWGDIDDDTSRYTHDLNSDETWDCLRCGKVMFECVDNCHDCEAAIEEGEQP